MVVDDHRSFGDALCIAIDLQPGLACRGAFPTAEAALASIDADGCADVALLDIGLPGMGGLAAVRALRDRCPALRVVVITADTSAQTVIDAVEAGAHGCLPKNHPFEQVLQAVRSLDDAPVAEGSSLARALRHATDAGGAPSTLDALDLTEREYQILLLMADGVPVKQVARALDISVHTCRGHVAALLRKFGVHSQLAAVVAAARLGLLPNLVPGGATADPQSWPFPHRPSCS